MVGVQINLWIGWVHPKSTHVILHTHSMKFQAPALKSIVLLLVYKLFYELCCFFFWQSPVLSFSMANILCKPKFSRCVTHIIRTRFCPWCYRFWAFLFLICHVFFGALWFWHYALFFVIWLHHFNICACRGILLFFHLVGNYIRFHELVHFLVICKCWCFIWIVFCILFISWPFLF